jgi:cell division protein FtsQ
MVPSLGDHTVLIGSVDNLADKLNRLYTFYKKVWVQSGINAYQVLDCRFDGQIVALKKGLEPIQYAPGMMPFQNSVLANTENVILNTDTLKKVAPIAIKKEVKLEENKVAKKPAVKVVANKKSTPKKINQQIKKKDNKQNNKSLINKKKSAKALMPTKTTSKNNNN